MTRTSNVLSLSLPYPTLPYDTLTYVSPPPFEPTLPLPILHTYKSHHMHTVTFSG